VPVAFNPLVALLANLHIAAFAVSLSGRLLQPKCGQILAATDCIGQVRIQRSGGRAAWIKLRLAPALLPLRSDPANNQFERPSAHGRIWFSTWLLSMGTAPSSK